MPEEKGELRLMVDEMVSQIRGMGKEMAKKLGPIGEPTTTKEQMAAFDAMTAEDWLKMTDERGPVETMKFMGEMLRRKKLQDANTKPI